MNCKPYFDGGGWRCSVCQRGLSFADDLTCSGQRTPAVDPTHNDMAASLANVEAYMSEGDE